MFKWLCNAAGPLDVPLRDTPLFVTGGLLFRGGGTKNFGDLGGPVLLYRPTGGAEFFAACKRGAEKIDDPRS